MHGRTGRSGRNGGAAAPSADRRVVALDGLRGVALAGVLIYHLGVSWLPGGLLGMDMFFVLSGFLITRLVVGEHRRTGRIDLRAFWVRRVRRLLPALLVMVLVVVCLLPWAAVPGTDVAGVRTDALAALAYVANWRFAFSHQSYFTHFTPPSPLLHLWSLGVEEQFYLLWPPVALAVLGVRRARRRRRAESAGPARRVLLARLAVAGVIASAGLTAVLASTGTDPSRLYYGTDTRAVALLVGAALACWAPLNPLPAVPPAGPHRHRVAAAVPRWLPVAGAAASAVLLFLWFRVSGQDPALYRGGFLLVAVCVAALIATIVLIPSGVPARVLSVRPLVALGRVSYSVYLWHWPIFQWLTNARTGLAGAPLLGARLGLALAVGTLSYRLVEQPFRLRRVRLPVPRFSVPALVAAVAVVAVAVQPASGGSAATDVASGLAAAERATVQQRSAAVAVPRTGAQRQLRIMISGDSLALTLGFALFGQPTGVDMIGDGIMGCSLAPGKGLPQGYGPDAFEPADCRAQEAKRWSADLAAFRPDLVALLVGRWETVDRRLPDGQVTHVGEPANDRLLLSNLDHAIDQLGSRGAEVALLTAPCFQGPERPDGGRYAQDDPARVKAFNALLRTAAARHPGRAVVVDLGAILCPGGVYHADIGGVPVRMSDGTHIARTAGPLLTRTLLPQLRRIAARPRG